MLNDKGGSIFMDIKLIAGIGFVVEVIASIFIFLVLVRQIKLFKHHVQEDLIWYRRILFIMSITIFVGSLLPMLIDLFTVFSLVRRTTDHVNLIGVVYFIANTLKSLLLSSLIWVLYRMAARTLINADIELARSQESTHDNTGARV